MLTAMMQGYDGKNPTSTHKIIKVVWVLVPFTYICNGTFVPFFFYELRRIR
jgi:hypothetical protein